MQSKISSGFYGLRRKQLSLTVIAVVCTTLLVWGWEKTPLASTFLLEQWQLETLPAAAKPASPSQQPINASWQVKTSAAVVSPEPAGSPSIITPVNASQPEAPSIIPISKEKNAVLAGCNYARGRWVRDARRRPLYSGFGCKRWLSPMWACRLTRRTDFSYESFRWQPESCEMQEFDRHSLLTRLQGKTIALVGDSLGRQQFQSLMCMLTGGEEAAEVDDVGREFGLVKAPGAIRPDGWAYRFPATNTTVLYYWSASLCELEPLNRSNPAATRYVMHLDRPAAFLRRHIGRFDVLVLNTGHHWNRGKISGNRWDMYVGGAPLRDRRMAEIYRAKNFTVHSVVRWVDSQLPHHPRLRAFLRSISPRHFVNGDWNSGGSCANTTPLLRGARVRDGGTTDDALAAAAVAGTGVRLLDITAPSELRDEAHMSNYSLRTSASGVHDCLHWCLPGVPDTWNEILLAQL